MRQALSTRILGPVIRPVIKQAVRHLASEIRADRPDEPHKQKDPRIVGGVVLDHLREFLMTPDRVREFFAIWKDDLVAALRNELTCEERHAFILFLCGVALSRCNEPDAPIPRNARYLEAEVARFIKRRMREGGPALVSPYADCITDLAQTLT